MLATTVKIIYTISRFFGYIATGIVAIMMCLTVSDIFGRYAFNSPIPGTTELSELMMVVVVFLALAWCAAARRHVKVDLIVQHLPLKVQLIIDSITLTAALGTYVIITWRSFIESAETDSITGLLRIPNSPFSWLLTFGFALLCLVIVAQMIENIMGRVRK